MFFASAKLQNRFPILRRSGVRALATPAIVDERLCEFTEHAWQQGHPGSVANQMPIQPLCSWSPGFRSTFHGSQCLLNAWGTIELPMRPTSLPPTFLPALVCAALRGRDLRMVVALMVAVCCVQEDAHTSSLACCHAHKTQACIAQSASHKIRTTSSVCARNRHAYRSFSVPVLGSTVAEHPTRTTFVRAPWVRGKTCLRSAFTQTPIGNRVHYADARQPQFREFRQS